MSFYYCFIQEFSHIAILLISILKNITVDFLVKDLILISENINPIKLGDNNNIYIINYYHQNSLY